MIGPDRRVSPVTGVQADPTPGVNHGYCIGSRAKYSGHFSPKDACGNATIAIVMGRALIGNNCTIQLGQGKEPVLVTDTSSLNSVPGEFALYW